MDEFEKYLRTKIRFFEDHDERSSAFDAGLRAGMLQAMDLCLARYLSFKKSQSINSSTTDDGLDDRTNGASS